MKPNYRFAVAGALALASVATHAESNLHTAIAMFANDQGGSSRDLDLMIAPSESWSLDTGVGSTDIDSEMGSVQGTSVRAGMSMRSERFGLRGYYRNYSDSSNFESDIFGARASMSHWGVTFNLIAEVRASDVEYTSSSASQPTRGTARIDTRGYGLGFAYAAHGWGAYAEGVFYDSGSRLESREVAGHASTLLGIPIAQQAGSSLVFKHGVLDHQVSAGVARGFRRSSLQLDWTRAQDAIGGAESNTLSGGFKYTLSSNLNVGITAGLTTSTLDSSKFAGASLVWSL